MKEFCSPGLSGMTPSKGISYEKNIAPSYRLTSVSHLGTEGINGSDRVEEQERMKLKLKVPVWNGDNLKVVMGFRYYKESFEFDDDRSINLNLHQDLASYNLRTLGSEINVLKPFRGNKYLIARGAFTMSGMFDSFSELNRDYLSYSFTTLFGNKFSDDLEMGLGIYYSNSLGLQSIYPIMLYNHNFNEKWGIEAVLPKKLTLRRNLNEKQLLSLQIAGESGKYFIPNADFAGSDNPINLRMEYTDVKVGLSYQREIFSILWGGVDVGYRKNLDLSFAKFGSDRRSFIYQSDVRGGLFVDFSLYITPPKKFRK
ncbi:DUF6268 family outer membrane beta-barrel protein [Flammeovirgaceae bacterium SG7u.111]|nr:DUF6268 family outer membrane beta-barrel protein [Flammeovirgaceae bacterium SG7u.132]WPO38315.1 DUF6268 family outer membrane beta-barrel protein [Flammeovirgaceae bacterium SG7u.111]